MHKLGLSFLAGTAAILAGWTGTADAGALYPDWPDAIICSRTDSSGPAFGTKYTFLHSLNEGTAVFDGYAIFRRAEPSLVNDYYFNSDGTSNGHSSGSYLDYTDCAGKSIAQLVDGGQAVNFGGGGDAMPAGAMTYFNLTECPAGWTRHLQLERSIQPDAPMLLCRKD